MEAGKKEQIELEKIKDGNWYKLLYKITYHDIKVLNGEWEHKELIFLCKDSWPTEESGIVLGKAVWPFRDNIRMVFEIDHTHGVYTSYYAGTPEDAMEEQKDTEMSHHKRRFMEELHVDWVQKLKDYHGPLSEADDDMYI